MPPVWIARGAPIVDSRVPRVMGIVNVTPDSFSDGGATLDPALALAQAREFAGQGADLLDLGGESSRPGAEPITLDEELRRVIPAVEAIREALPLVPLSIDTVKPEVARRALGLGVSIVNDISGLSDPEMARVVLEYDAGVVLMHMAGTPRTMQHDPRYGDVVREVYDDLARRVDAAERSGIARTRIAIDPGIGFGKSFEHNLGLLRSLCEFAKIGCVTFVGTSRKGFLGLLTGRSVGERATASVVSSLAAIVSGASVVRVHDVGPMVDAVKVWGAIQGWNSES